MEIKGDKLKALGIPDSELIEAWNPGNVADSYFPVQEMYFHDKHKNTQKVVVEALTDDNGSLGGDDLDDSFPGWTQHLVHTGLDVHSPLEQLKERRSIVMHAATGYFEVKGSEVSLGIDRAKPTSEPPKAPMYLLFLLPKGRREVVWGDITEMYSIRQRELGKFHSYLWLYKEVCLSMWPLLRQALVNLGKRTYRFYI